MITFVEKVEAGILEKENFRLLWKQIPETNELVYEISKILP